MKINYKKLDGLIPVIVQDKQTLQVLMLGFMNEEAFNLTKKTKKVTFWSRTKNRIWQKGETSKNYLTIQNTQTDIKLDCDNDTLLIMATPTGPTCHKKTYSCFGEKTNNIPFLNELFELIQQRKKDLPKNSYTTTLFKKGLNTICQKVGEESIEVVIAAQNQTSTRLTEESADLLFHLLVLLAEKKLPLTKVIQELIRRHK